jgi:chromatin remodeling complex protein RSC6
MSITTTNWVYMPQSWHDFMKSSAYSKKANVTTFLKSIYDYVEKRNLYSQQIDIDDDDDDDKDKNKDKDKWIINCDEKLQGVLYEPKIIIRKLETHIFSLLKYVYKTSNVYSFIWNIVVQYPFIEHTLEEFKNITGFKLYKEGWILEDDWENEDFENLFNKKSSLKDYCTAIYKLLIDVEEEEWEIFLEEEWNDIRLENLNNGEFPQNLKVKYLVPLLNYEYYQHYVNKIENWSGFAQSYFLSFTLCDFLGITVDDKLSRTEVTRRIINYIKDNKLEDADNRRIIIPDDSLTKVVGTPEEREQLLLARKCDLEKRGYIENAKKVNVSEQLSYFNLQLFLNKHFLKKRASSTQTQHKLVMKKLCDEIMHVAYIPPKCDTLPLFNKGGIRYNEVEREWQQKV